MLFIKYFILFLILISSTSIGFIISNKFYKRELEINAFIELLIHLKNEIKFTKVTLSEAFENISKIQINKNISRIAKVFSINIKHENSAKAWSESIEKNKNLLSLTGEDIIIVRKIGSSLGKTDVNGQISELNNYLMCLQSQLETAQNEKNKNAKLYKSLGTIIGLIMIIILV